MLVPELPEEEISTSLIVIGLASSDFSADHSIGLSRGSQRCAQTLVPQFSEWWGGWSGASRASWPVASGCEWTQFLLCPLVCGSGMNIFSVYCDSKEDGNHLIGPYSLKLSRRAHTKTLLEELRFHQPSFQRLNALSLPFYYVFSTATQIESFW